ncbi:hypothetical protein A2U01_0095745, partial [Trifolium medium]|nr:hypothetical protein [Trifolium medium]
ELLGRGQRAEGIVPSSAADVPWVVAP